MLERGCLSGLPDGIYRRSIINAVAREVGLNPDQLLAEFTALHPADLPALPSVALAEPKAATSFNKVLTLVSAVLPMLAGILYFALPMTRGMIADRPRAGRAASAAPSRCARRSFRSAASTTRRSPPSRPVPVVVTLTISSRCQLRVVADGNEILGRTMEQGETLPIELGDELLLLGDNASAVQFSINGQAGRQLGEPGDVLSARIGRDDYQDFLVRY